MLVAAIAFWDAHTLHPMYNICSDRIIETVAPHCGVCVIEASVRSIEQKLTPSVLSWHNHCGIKYNQQRAREITRQTIDFTVVSRHMVFDECCACEFTIGTYTDTWVVWSAMAQWLKYWILTRDMSSLIYASPRTWPCFSWFCCIERYLSIDSGWYLRTSDRSQ